MIVMTRIERRTGRYVFNMAVHQKIGRVALQQWGDDPEGVQGVTGVLLNYCLIIFEGIHVLNVPENIH